MRLVVAIVAFLFVVAPSQVLQDDTPLSEAEQYLAPYEEQLVSYRDNPIAKRFIALANLVDVVPTWLMDAFVPLIIPDSTLRMPMNLQLPIPFPVAGIHGIDPAIAHLEVSHVSINKLNEFKKLKPIKFQENSRYTWEGHMIWEEGTATTLQVGVKFVINQKFSFPVNVTMTVTSPGVDFGMIVAFDREKMCDVWGHVLQSSEGCAAHALFMDAEKGISGMKLSELTLHASDFSLDDVQVPSLPFGLDKRIVGLIQELLDAKKSEILKNMETSVSKAALEGFNAGQLLEIPLIQQYYPCDMDAVAPCQMYPRCVSTIMRLS